MYRKALTTPLTWIASPPFSGFSQNFASPAHTPMACMSSNFVQNPILVILIPALAEKDPKKTQIKINNIFFIKPPQSIADGEHIDQNRKIIQLGSLKTPYGNKYY